MDAAKKTMNFMTMRAGQVYRHEHTGVEFKIDDIMICANQLEGGLSVKVRVTVQDEDEAVYCFGFTQLERMWPHLGQVPQPEA